MAKKIGTSRPMTLDVLLPPFIESFQIAPSDAVSQWHYDQDGSYLPDRQVSPLILTPTLNVQDPETKRIYKPSFSKVRWYLLNATTKKYDIEITNTEDDDPSGDYVIIKPYATGRLKVRKNVHENAPVNLLCSVEYVDPRNAGKTYTCTETQQLTTSRDTSVTSPKIEINQESPVKYNPFIDGYTTDSYGVKHHNFTFIATARMGDALLDVTGASSHYRIKWYALGEGITSETPIDETESAGGTFINKFPCYVSGQSTPSLVVDAMLTNNITIIARVLNTTTNKLYPEKCICHLTWDSFKVDATSEAIDGGAVKQSTQSKTFRNIVTIRNRTIDQGVVNENFLQDWKFRNAANASVESLGSGPTVQVPASKLKAQQSSIVYSELSLLGAQKPVDYNNAIVVDDTTGRVVIDRD